jgi:hypothetical protein
VILSQYQKNSYLTNISEDINKILDRFDTAMPKMQMAMLEDLLDQLSKLKLRANGRVAISAENIRALARLKSRLRKVLLTDEYKQVIKDFVKDFRGIDTIIQDYYREAEIKYTPSALTKEFRKQSIKDVAEGLVGAGFESNVVDKIYNVIKTNISSGVSYKQLHEQLKEQLLTTETGGLLQKYVKQIVTDSTNQYTAQYMQAISTGLNFKWYRYTGRDITTTRHFCDAMTDQPYFHVSQIPDLLKAKGLKYENKDGEMVPVEINTKTGLPQGMYPETTPENFLVLRGGYGCRHLCLPVAESQVPLDIRKKFLS